MGAERARKLEAPEVWAQRMVEAESVDSQVPPLLKFQNDESSVEKDSTIARTWSVSDKPIADFQALHLLRVETHRTTWGLAYDLDTAISLD